VRCKLPFRDPGIVVFALDLRDRTGGIMRKIGLWIALSGCLFAFALFAWAQSTRQPGLWEVTSTMTWIQSPMPAGMPANPNSPFGGGPHTAQICVTQAQIDKYGGLPPQTRAGCQMTDIQKRPNGMTATIACTGMMTATGTVEASWIDDEHTRSKVHLTGTMQMGQQSRPVEWTIESTSAFKGADCGSVQPIAVPAN
jgi:hypothetical protein